MTTQEIADALDTFRNSNGTRWKSKLNDLFFSGRNRSPELQYFRNHHLPILSKIKFTTTKREIIALLSK